MNDDRTLALLTTEVRFLRREIQYLRLELRTMAATLDQVVSDVAAQTTVINSAITLLQQIKAALDAAIATGDLAKVQAVATQIEANTAALAAAVAANTPAAPPAGS